MVINSIQYGLKTKLKMTALWENIFYEDEIWAGKLQKLDFFFTIFDQSFGWKWPLWANVEERNPSEQCFAIDLFQKFSKKLTFIEFLKIIEV